LATDDLTQRQIQGERSRKELLAVAKRLLAERGYTGMTVSRLSKAAGLSASSIYWHFGSKDGVLAAVVEQGLRDFFAARPKAADYEGEPIERFAQMLEESAAMIAEEPEYLRLLLILTLERHDGNEDARRVVDEMRASSLANFEAALEPILAPGGEAERLALVRDVAKLFRAAADGALIASLDEEDVSMVDVYRTLLTLLRAHVESTGQAIDPV
jgi:AcrR family transcriptional regulator